MIMQLFNILNKIKTYLYPSLLGINSYSMVILHWNKTLVQTKLCASFHNTLMD